MDVGQKDFVALEIRFSLSLQICNAVKVYGVPD
jgi:hypothetical protein